MNMDPPSSGVIAHLRRWTWREKDDAPFREAADLGPSGIALLSKELGRRKGQYERERIVSFLARLDEGDVGAILKSVLTLSEPGTMGMRVIAAQGLARQQGSAATPALVEALGDRSPDVRWQALTCLAVVGTGEAWTPVIELLEKMMRRPSKVQRRPPPEVCALCYLSRFLDDSDRVEALANLFRKYWGRLQSNVRLAVEEVWPDVQPGGPEVERVRPPDCEGVELAVL